ncbi:hypothetical protein V7S43_003712 [Phytophthora oleae]|uniref:Kinesin motor domain-containing protein n=1 Tax=Phytophthora oleae TaxID=2107226 RepID=A0ABD3G012_9STRA
MESALRRYNCTCFVYGQTGSGKIFSVEGVPGDKAYEGIIPRVVANIFDGIENMQADLEFIARVSYVEIYMEKIRDLLKPSSTNLNVRESRERGVWIAGATEVCCASAEEMQSVMQLVTLLVRMELLKACRLCSGLKNSCSTGHGATLPVRQCFTQAESWRRRKTGSSLFLWI